VLQPGHVLQRSFAYCTQPGRIGSRLEFRQRRQVEPRTPPDRVPQAHRSVVEAAICRERARNADQQIRMVGSELQQSLTALEPTLVVARQLRLARLLEEIHEPHRLGRC
jgi:hypothetical protein